MFRTYIDTNNPQGMQLRRFKNRTPARKTQDEDKQNKAQKQRKQICKQKVRKKWGGPCHERL
jgi:hypothetical protein